MSFQELDGKSRKNSQSTSALNQNEEEVPSKRSKPINSSVDIASLRRENFCKAFELVSLKAYLNYAERLQLIYLPVCIDRDSCSHTSVFLSLHHYDTQPIIFSSIYGGEISINKRAMTSYWSSASFSEVMDSIPKGVSLIKEIQPQVKELTNFEMKASNWCGALEVCLMSITPNQYLSSVVLKYVVEMMLNTHEDLDSGYTISEVIDKCMVVLSLHFSTHCPCLHGNIREVYINFLTSPMDRKQNTFTNRTNFGSEKGIVNFCLTRLEYELSPESTDGALLDKNENTPEDLRGSVRGAFYQNERFSIFEMLDRTERINRLMAVLHSIIELLQFDLAICQSISNSGIITKQRGRKYLMASVLEQFTHCIVTSKKILKLFAYFVHLEYPEEHIKTMTLWLNAVVEYFYMNETQPNIDYPSPRSSCKRIINEFYDIIKDLPPKSIINILERIKPAYYRYQISNHHSKTLLEPLCDENESIINILIEFLKKAKWNNFPRNENNLVTLKKLNAKRVRPNKLLEHLTMICKNVSVDTSSNNNVLYPKFYPAADDGKIDRSHVICTLYVAFQSYMEAYGIQSVQETLQKLNEDLMDADTSRDTDSNMRSDTLPACQSYQVTQSFSNVYRRIFASLRDLILTMKEIESDIPPEMLNIFTNILNFSNCLNN